MLKDDKAFSNEIRWKYRIIVPAFAGVFGCSQPPAENPVTLEASAERVARFLSGSGQFDAFDTADSVDLYVAPDGGGGHTRISRDQLRDRNSWQVVSNGVTRSFIAPAGDMRLTTVAGRYMNCQPSELATRYPHLAAMPHVGVRLQRDDASSCLQTWSATFLYDTTGRRTRLVGAIYDQWEW